MTEAMEMVHGIIEGRLRPADRRSPFFAIPFLRTNFWRGMAAAGMVAAAAGGAWFGARKSRR